MDKILNSDYCIEAVRFTKLCVVFFFFSETIFSISKNAPIFSFHIIRYANFLFNHTFYYYIYLKIVQIPNRFSNFFFF